MSGAPKAAFWAAVCATVFSLAYDVAQIGEWMGLLGSAGGPESASTPIGLVVLLLPSLLLGSSFLVLVAAAHQATRPRRRIWSQISLAFATAYAVLISLVYFVQLALVAPRIAQGRVGGIELLLFVPFDSFLYAVDILGYSFMSVSALFLAFAFDNRGMGRAARVLLIGNGLLLPFIALQMFYHPLLYVAALWAILFPAATAVLAVMFRRSAARRAGP
jgi:hypothetical protein